MKNELKRIADSLEMLLRAYATANDVQILNYPPLQNLQKSKKRNGTKNAVDPYAGQYVVYDYYKDQIYNNEKVNNGIKDIFIKAKEICTMEGYPELLEIQAMGIEYDPAYRYAKVVENPKYSLTGTACVCRVKTNKGLSAWVFYDNYESAADCATDCACHCAYALSHGYTFRAKVFSKIEVIK